MKTNPIGDLIRFRRIELGYMQMEIAKAIGDCSPREISAIERGLSRPTVEQLDALNRLLKFDPAALHNAVIADFNNQFGSEEQ